MINSVAIGTLGGLVAYKLRIPAGALVGSMAAVVIAKLSGGHLAALPSEAKIATQIVVGVIIGVSIKELTWASIKSLAIPAVVICVCLMLAGVVSGLILTHLLHIDPVTAFFSSMPGGMNEMALAASDYGAHGPSVVILHFVRLVVVLCTSVPLIKWLSR
jgi:membrane AbrB-like protein